MIDQQLRVWCDPDDGNAGRVLEEIRQQVPTDLVQVEPRHVGAMAVGELLVLAFTHIAVIGLIEGAHLVWDLYRAPVKVQLPNGAVVTVQGAPQELIDEIRKLVENLSQLEKSTANRQELEDLLAKVREYSAR